MDCAPQCRTALVAIRRMGVPGYFLLCYRHRLREVLLKLRDRQRLIRSSFVGSLGCGLRVSRTSCRASYARHPSAVTLTDISCTAHHGPHMVGHVIEIEHRLRRVSRAVYGVFGLCYESRTGTTSSRRVCGSAGCFSDYVTGCSTTRTVPCGTTDEARPTHYMDYPQEAPGSGGFQSR